MDRQRFRRVRRRTVDIGALRDQARERAAEMAQTINEEVPEEEEDDRIPELEKIADRGVTERRRSVKREAEDTIPVRNKVLTIK